MKNQRKHLKYLFLLTILFCLCHSASYGQPTCFSTFPVSETCNVSYPNSEYVFVGKIVSFEPAKDYRNKVVVEVEKSIKGKVVGRIELLLISVCSGHASVGGRYIFTAEQSILGNITRLFSNYWSEYIPESLSKEEYKKLILKIVSVTKKEKQSRIVGEVQRQFNSELTDYMVSEFKSTYSTRTSDGTLITLPVTHSRFSTSLNYYRPFSEVVIEAKQTDGKRFISRTDKGGKFEFKHLPNGKYEIHPILANEFTSNTFFSDIGNHLYTGIPSSSAIVEIDDAICSKQIDFTAAVVGNLHLHISNLEKDWLYSPTISLFRVDKSGFRDIYEPNNYYVREFTSLQTGSTFTVDFVIKGIPIGQYTLPIVSEIDDAEVIEIKANTTTNISYEIPNPRRK